MANTIAYTSTNSPTGSLKSGVISINLNTQITGQNYNWRNGIVFSNQYIIYSDTFTQGIDTEANAKPCAWACDYNDTALLNLINSLPPRIGQAQYGSLADAIAWLQGENKYFIVNQNYPTIVTDGLTLLLEPGLTGGYPLVGTTFYDVSGNNYNGALVNGTSWSNSGTTSFFNYDGTDDFVRVASNNAILSTSTYTKIAIFNANTFTPSNNIISGGNTGQHAFWLAGGNRLNSGHNGLWSTVQSSTTLSLNRWYFGAATFNTSTGWVLYLNGTAESTSSSTTTFNGSGNIQIGAYGESNLFSGKIGLASVYNRVLSATEILQNYYKGPIVTNGLNTAFDFSNLVSYGGTSTTTYDLTSRANNGTLQNGISYSINTGGVMYFDGTDDFLQMSEYTSYSFGNTPTVTMWIKPVSAGTYGLLSHCSGGPVNLGYGLENGYMSYRNYDGQWNYYASNAYVGGGSWTHVAWVKETATSLKFYVNGVLQDAITITNTNGPINTIGSYWGPCDGGGFNMFNGWIGSVYLYSQTALNASEVMQNYTAHRNRFESNQAFATGGSITTVNENGINYRVHTFTSSGTLTVLSPGKVEALVVAGGGGGGAYAAGAGGGAGGLIYNTDCSVTTGNKTVTVGAGGVGQDYTVANQTSGNNSVFDDLTSVGGGYGGAGWAGQAGANGGSGGGGAGFDGTQGTSTVAGGTGTSGQGFNGGLGRGISTNRGAGGGGGGAGVPGGDSTTNSGGNGGNGKQISINGTATYYAGGGGGGDYGSANGGIGGLGGGGNVSGGNSSSVPAGNGGTNTGGGGGGSRSATSDSWDGGNGGSGIVIIRYRI